MKWHQPCITYCFSNTRLDEALSGIDRELLAYGRAWQSQITKEELRQWKQWLVAGAEAEAAEATESASCLEPVDEPEAEQEPAETEIKDLEVEEVKKMDSLREYQKAAVDAVAKAAKENCCVVLPCGAGKTRVGAAIAAEFIQSPWTCVVVVLCLRREGVRQWARELSENWDIEAYEAGQTPLGELPKARIILVTYHRMLSDRRRALKKGDTKENDFLKSPNDLDPGGSVTARFRSAEKGLLIADECHMVPAPKIGELLANLLNDSERRLVGLTATLLRESGVPGADDEDGEVPWPLLGKCVFRETFANLAPQFLAAVRCVEVSVPVAGPWRKLFEQPLAPAVCLSGGKWSVLEHLLAKHAEDSLLITVERCEQARHIASMFGIIPIDGSVPAAQMKDYLERFRQRKILALVATHVLDDSADFPELFVSRLHRVMCFMSVRSVIIRSYLLMVEMVALPTWNVYRTPFSHFPLIIETCRGYMHFNSFRRLWCSKVMIQMGGHFASRRQEQQRLGRLLRWGPVKRQRWEDTGATWLRGVCHDLFNVQNLRSTIQVHPFVHHI